VQADADSMSNTPPTYTWSLSGLVFAWLKSVGGLAAMEELNRRKAKKLYDAINASNFYQSPIEPGDRSVMNVPFTLPDSELDAEFLEQAGQRGLLNLKGHRSVGGMRASLYNAVTEAAVDALVDFMGEFENERG
jgi:phosphoserine aminotransferase